MVEDRIRENIKRELRPLVHFIRFWLIAILVSNLVALAAAGYVLSKLGEFWAVDSRNIYRRLERLEELHK